MEEGRRIRIGLLDFLWAGPANDYVSVIQSLSEHVLAAEQMGFHRYWLGEHHVHGYATGSILALLSWAASQSCKIRVGTGATLLAYHSPFVLAQEMCVLNALSGRVDLGVGRGRADLRSAHEALLDGRPWNAPALMEQGAYAAKLESLDRSLSETAAGLAGCGRPELWVCGSANAAEAAASIGARFCYTLFHPGKKDAALLQRYRDAFLPSADLSAPIAAVALCGTWAETDAEAEARVASHPYIVYHPSVVGGPDEAARRWDEAIDRYSPDDVMWLDIATQLTARRASWQRLIDHANRSGLAAGKLLGSHQDQTNKEVIACRTQ